jgi:hypothetical protein
MEAVSIIQETLTILIDQFMDFLVVIFLWDDREQRGDAIIMLCMLFVAHVSMMGALSLVTRQAPTMTLLSLLGFKPIVEGARQLNGTKARPTRLISTTLCSRLLACLMRRSRPSRSHSTNQWFFSRRMSAKLVSGFHSRSAS